MKITNVSAKISLKPVLLTFAISVGITILFCLLFLSSGPAEISFSAFFKWYGDFIQYLTAEHPEDIIEIWLFVGLGPIIVYGTFFFMLIYRQIQLSQFKSGLNLKYINLKDGNIDFVFNKKGFDFSCGYKDIEKIDMIIKTERTTRYFNKHSRRYVIVISEIQLAFYLLNKKKFKIANTGCLSPINMIYKIIDNTRPISNLINYEVDGPDDGIMEKVQTYVKKNYKQRYTLCERNRLKFASVGLLIMAIMFILVFKDTLIKNPYDSFLLPMLLIPLSILIIPSIIIDILVIIDENNEKKYGNRGLNG